MRALPWFLFAATVSFAEDAPAYHGFRADLREAGAVLRVKLGEACEGPRPAVVERAFKGDFKAGDKVLLVIDAEAWTARLQGDLAEPGGMRGRGLPFFEQPGAPGDSQIVLAKRGKDGLVVAGLCLADAASVDPPDEARKRDRETADELVASYLQASTTPDEEAAATYFRFLIAQFSEESPGACELAIGIIADDFERVAGALKRDERGIERAHAFVLAGGAEKNAQVAALRGWLTKLLAESHRREAAGFYAGEYRKTRREAEEMEKKEREPKDPRKKPPPDRFETTAAKKFGIQSRLKELPKLMALALDPKNPPAELSTDELLEKADSFSRE
ncbi:MAG: hypothetical protein FD180_4280 [Planctomycetota bacterium]|nr:MAG: hypothetical protein FD180_4280 [Planctomycetota bacterium]